MLTIQFETKNNFDALTPGLHSVLQTLPLSLNQTFILKDDTDCLNISLSQNQTTIHFHTPNELFRGIGLAASALLSGQTAFSFTQKMPFKTLGAMYDCSRNSVPTVESVKKILIQMALMGYNCLMLYTEDTYTVDSHPEFGHYRGRYSKEELTEIDNFAFSLGIEVIPCIQALAHLERFLRWPCTSSLKDNDFILLAEDDEVYTLIEDMILSISSCVRSNRIHLGLDEAHGLGLGTYLAKHGYAKPEDIMKTHLIAVKNICLKHQLDPMMWGDMIFRMNIDGNGYYDPDVELPHGTGDIIPKEFGFIYWDYYHTDEDFYLKYFDQHKKQGITPLFAGGVCSWIGMVPNLVRTYTTTKNSVCAAKKTGVEEMFLCIWKDDGGEALPGPDYLGMLMYAENCYGENGIDDTLLKQNAFICTGAPYESFMAVGSIDEILEGVSLTLLEAPNPHKYFLWQDILLGQFDCEANISDFASVYRKKADQLDQMIAEKNYTSDALYGLKLGYYLCRVLTQKVDLGIRLKKAYDHKDHITLHLLKDEIDSSYKEQLLALFNWHRESWHHFYKPFGWEVADIKYGYLISRANTTVYRLEQYLSGNLNILEELEEQRLTSTGCLPDQTLSLPHMNNFCRAVTVGQF